MNGVLVITEQRRGAWNPQSWEALAAGQELGAAVGQPLRAATLGNSPAEPGRAMVERWYVVGHDLLEPYTADGYTAALEQLVRKLDPAYVLFPHTYQVRDYAPKLAARFSKTLIADVTAIRTEGGTPVFVRQLMQGKLSADYRQAGPGPCFVSLQAGAFDADRLLPGEVPVEAFAPALNPAQIRSKPGEPFRASEKTVDLSSAPVIVSVGRGIKEKDNLPVVEELARALGAEIAASRPICDNGWLPMERQVGSSGQTVSPKLYFAVGISGAIQHLVGMKGSKTVIAVNKDENAPIFEIADYGVVGDLFEVVPALTAAVRKTKGMA
jgi:electron transfer flavoprotein alpha subunit